MNDLNRKDILEEIHKKYPQLDNSGIKKVSSLLEASLELGLFLLRPERQLSTERVRVIVNSVESIINVCIME